MSPFEVVEAFCRLHELGIHFSLALKVFIRSGAIFRGQRMVNWSPVLQTAVSDLEVLSSTQLHVMARWSMLTCKGISTISSRDLFLPSFQECF